MGKLGAWLQHAFAVPKSSDFTPTDSERELVTVLAQELRRRNLLLPASVLIESFRPMGFLASQAVLVSYPWFAALTDAAGLKILGQMLERPGSVDWMLDELNRPDAPA